MKTLRHFLIFAHLTFIGCSGHKGSEETRRNSVSQYIAALQKKDADKLYEFELPEFKNSTSLDDYKAHNLLDLVDSIPIFNYLIKKVEIQNETARVLIEFHLLETESTKLDSLTAIFIKENWSIPTFSSDINSR